MAQATDPHVLLIEDDDAHAQLIMALMDQGEHAGSISHVRDGAEAIEHLASVRDCDATRPDLVLLDLHIPKVDGHVVLEHIKRDQSLKTIPVVILTTSASREDRQRAYERHANSYLTKPMDFDEFDRMIHDLLVYWGVWNQRPVIEVESEIT